MLEFIVTVLVILVLWRLYKHLGEQPPVSPA